MRHGTRAASSSGSDCVRDKRLGIYVDFVYREVAVGGSTRISTDRAVILFMLAVADAFAGCVVFGRALSADADAEYVLPARTRLVALPHYENLRRLPQVARASVRTVRLVWAGLADVDVVWVFGPHPFAAVTAVLAAVRRKQVLLGVRQHSVKLYRTRLRGWKRFAGVATMWALDGVFRMLVRLGRARMTVQGEELSERYGRQRPTVLTMTLSAIRERDIVDVVPPRDWSGELELLTVGRLEPEKNPSLLIEALAELDRQRPGRFKLTWVGRGPLEETVRQHARRAGVDRLITFHGYVPFHGGLLDLYRRAHAFVHVSLSEGMPMVLIEALASGTPVVATDVGGVRAAMGDGAAALLVPPRDARALVDAIRRLVDDDELRRSMAARGLERAHRMTLEAEAERVVRFIAGGTAGGVGD